MTDRPIPLMTEKRAEAAIRALSLDPSRVTLTIHAEERMLERGFGTRDLFEVLAKGGDWKCKVVKRLRGSRDAGVVTVIAGAKPSSSSPWNGRMCDDR